MAPNATGRPAVACPHDAWLGPHVHRIDLDDVAGDSRLVAPGLAGGVLAPTRGRPSERSGRSRCSPAGPSTIP